MEVPEERSAESDENSEYEKNPNDEENEGNPEETPKNAEDEENPAEEDGKIQNLSRSKLCDKFRATRQCPNIFRQSRVFNCRKYSEEELSAAALV